MKVTPCSAVYEGSGPAGLTRSALEGEMAGRKRKPEPLLQTRVKSLRRARSITSRFHELTQQAQAAARTGNTAAEAAAEHELQALGGREAYQSASQLTTSRHRTSKWVFSILTELGMRPGKGAPPLPVLEVGAVNAQLSSVPWLHVTAIDLRPCLPSIQQQDFFNLPQTHAFAAVICCMVLNCVPAPEQRGAMLQGLRAHLQPDGLAFVMLPRRCLEESSAMSLEMFQQALAAVGLPVIRSKTSPKLAFFCSRAAAADEHAATCFRTFSDSQAVRGKDKFKVILSSPLQPG